MSESFGEWRKAIIRLSVGVTTFIFLICAPFCSAQVGSLSEVTGCFPINHNLPDTGGDSWLYPDGPPDYNPIFNQYNLDLHPRAWAPNQTYTVTIDGNFPVGYNWSSSAINGCPNVFISAVKSDGSCNGVVCGGLGDPYVSLSELKFGSPIKATFKVSIGNAPEGEHYQIQVYSEAGMGLESYGRATPAAANADSAYLSRSNHRLRNSPALDCG